MKKCFIVVDYQNDFVDGSLGFPGAAALEAAIAEKIRQCRDRGDEVIFTLDTHGDDYAETQEGRNLAIFHCLENTPGHRLYGEVENLARVTDKKFCKGTFGSDELYEYLRAHPFAEIELAGVVSNICVIANAILAKTAQPETPILVDVRCTASADDALHNAALDVMAGMHIQITGRA